jgi:hypothetical protein
MADLTAGRDVGRGGRSADGVAEAERGEIDPLERGRRACNESEEWKQVALARAVRTQGKCTRVMQTSSEGAIGTAGGRCDVPMALEEAR